MSSRKPKVAVLGSLNVDLVTRTPRLPSAGETLTSSSFDIGWGGKGANQAVACSRLSRRKRQPGISSPEGEVDVQMIGCVGDDAFAADFLKSLEGDGVDVSEVRKVRGMKTGTAVIIVEEETAENRILISPGGNAAVQDKVLVGEDVDVLVCQLEIPLQVVLRNIESAKAKGTEVILNPAPAIPLPDSVFKGLDHLVMNETEAALLVGTQFIFPTVENLIQVGEIFMEKGVKNVIITLGEEGVFYKNSETEGEMIPARRVKEVDTTAAGDTFVGGYSKGLALHKAGKAVSKPQKETQEYSPIADAIEFANRAASVTVQREGAQAAIPWLDEVPDRRA